MRFSLCFLLTTFLFAFSCMAPPTEEAVVDDTAQEEADIQSMHRILELWDEADAAGDVNGHLALVTDDYIRMEPDKPAIVGKEAFRETLQSFHDKYSLQDGKNVIEEIRLAGNWAYFRNTWSGTVIPKDGGDPVHVTMKWMGITEHQADGSWKISRNCGNSEAPLGLD